MFLKLYFPPFPRRYRYLRIYAIALLSDWIQSMRQLSILSRISVRRLIENSDVLVGCLALCSGICTEESVRGAIVFDVPSCYLFVGFSTDLFVLFPETWMAGGEGSFSQKKRAMTILQSDHGKLILQ